MPDVQYTITPEIIFESDTELRRGDPVIMAIDGGFVVVWQAGNTVPGYQTYMRLFDLEGNPTTEDIEIGQFEQNLRSPVVSAGDSGIVVVWQDFDENFEFGNDITDISAQLFDFSGNATSDVFQIDDAMHNRNPDVQMLSDGGFISTWTTGAGLVARFFDSNGVALSASFIISVNELSPFLNRSERDPAVTELSNGNIVITWTSSSDDGTGAGVQAVVLDSTGAVVQSEFQVNTFVDNTQGLPVISALADGGFVVVWESIGQDGSGRGIYFQIFDEVGNAVGAETQVNSFISGDQSDPDVVARPDGTFLVTWDSSNSTSNQDIYAQLFDQEGNAIGSETRVNFSTLGIQRDSSVAVLEDGTFVVVYEGNLGQGLDITFQLISTDIINAGPVATDDGGFSVTQGGSIEIGISALLSNDFDPDGDGIEFVSFVQPENGFAFLTSDGQITYFGNGEYVGIDTFNYTITDEFGATDEATVSIEVQPAENVLSSDDRPGALNGTNDDDVMVGNSDDNHMNGKRGDDALFGREGDDFLNGQQGDDRLSGGQGDDILKGGSGNDQLIGGEGDDQLQGGSDADSFVFFGDIGNDVISDFVASDGDVLIIQRSLAYDADGVLQAQVSEVGGDTVIELIGGNSITITGVSAADIDLDSFIF